MRAVALLEWTTAVLFLLCLFAGPAPADDHGMPKAGQKAPDIDLQAVMPGQDAAHKLRLSDYRNKKNVVLYFFPKALTGG